MPVSPEMKTHLNGNTSLGVFMKITSLGGDVLRVWNGTRNKIVGGELFYAFPLAPSQLQTSNGLKPDNLEAASIYSGLFNAATLRNKKWQNARVEYRVLDYKNFDLGYAERRSGFLGEATVGKHSANIELKSLSKKLSEPFGFTYQEDCNVIELGDDRCKVDLTGYTADGFKMVLNAHVVTPVLNPQQFSVEFDEAIYGGVQGLRASYFADKNLSSLAFQRNDAKVDFDYGMNAPASGLPVDGFSVRWEGTVTPLYSETYTFSVEHDDGARLWVNNLTTPLIDQWVDGPGTHTATIALTAGVAYPIKLEFYDLVNVSKIKLRWQSASQAFQIIPQSRLALPTQSAVPDNFYKFGKIEFVTGANAGAVQQIAVNASNALTLLLPMFFTPAVDDEIILTVGCDRKIATCRDRFNNAINNRSFYALPGRRKMVLPER